MTTKISFRQRFRNLSKRLIVLFLIMFVFRMLYGYFANEKEIQRDYSGDFFGSVENLRKNYASEIKYSAKAVPNTVPQAMINSQKYEKTANIKSKSSQFDEDNNSIKSLTRQFEGIIQYEQSTGNKGNRELHLMIGISPELFDSFYLRVQRIGVIRATDVRKVDMTTEYRQLNAKKASLEKTLASLNELKSRGGAIADYISLHDKILEIEQSLQNLGVELGNFDSENEFCTIKFSLYEGASEHKVSFIHRVKVSLEWTIQYFAILMFALVCLSVGVFVLLLIIDKLKIMKSIQQTLNE